MHIRPLPLRVRVMAGESTGSYVTRLAARHGQAVGWLLSQTGDGQTSAEVDPRFSELYMDRTARARLAGLCGRPVGEMARALGSLRDELLLPDGGGGGVWKWPWRPRAGFLVRGCALCTASSSAKEPVWLMRPDPWHICVRHRRFMDNTRDDHQVPFIGLAPGPHVVAAERQRLALLRRLGSVGRVLIGDAFGVLAHSEAPRLGSGRTAPLHLLPKAVEVASRMARVEPRRVDGRLSHHAYSDWLRQVETEGNRDLVFALTRWSLRHLVLDETPPRNPGTRPEPAFPHTAVPEMASVDKISCLPWRVLARPERPYG